MTRIDPGSFANSYLAGARLGTQQFQMVDEMQQRAMQQQREQEQLMRTRQILKGVLQQASAPALAVPQPPGGMGPPMQNAPDSGGFGSSIQQNNKDIDELSNMIDVASPDSLKFIAGLVEDRRKMAQALADARHAWDRGIVNHLDDQAHPEFAAFARDWAAENNPERKMERWDNFQKQQAENQKAMQQNEEWNRKQEVLQTGREKLQQGSQAFTAFRDSAKAKGDDETMRAGAAALKRLRTNKSEDRDLDYAIARKAGLAQMEDVNLSGRGMSKDVAALARETNAPVDGLALIPGTDRVDDVDGEEWVTVEKGGKRYEIKKAMWPIIQKFGSWEAAIAALRQANGKPAELAPSPPIGGGGFAQTTSTTPAPGAPTQASGDPMAAARAALGDNATIEQIEQWMEAQGL